VTLIEILLPLNDNAGKPQPAKVFGDLRRLLTERYGGLTAFNRTPADGIWVDPDKGAVRHDDVVVLEVMADYLDRTWWGALRQRLEAELHQESIVIRAHSVEPL
jgi:hypothetical protein